VGADQKIDFARRKRARMSRRSLLSPASGSHDQPSALGEARMVLIAGARSSESARLLAGL